MPHQPKLVPSGSSEGSASLRPTRNAPLWLHRAEFFLRVLVRIYIGLIVIVLPWTLRWNENPFFLYFHPVAAFTANGAVRGLVTGLGFLNLWIAISEAIHYSES